MILTVRNEKRLSGGNKSVNEIAQFLMFIRQPFIVQTKYLKDK